MKVRNWTNEHLVYLLAFGVAILLRMLLLDQWPLSEAESSPALQALAVARGTSTAAGSEPGYVLLTGLLFWLVDDNTFLARFLPSLAGSLLVFAPFFFRHELGKTAGIILAFGLALDPGLVAISRQAAGPVLAAALIVMTCAAVVARRHILAGVLLGLSLLGGPAVWQGALVLVGGWLLYTRMVHTDRRMTAINGDIPRIFLPMVLPVAGITLVLAGTLFFQVPGGLASVGSSLASFLSGWRAEGDLRPYQWLLLLVLYEILPLILGLAAAVRGWVRGQAVEQFLSLTALAGLIIGLLYPARSPGDLVWVLIPVWALAAREAARILAFVPQERYAHIAHTVLTLCIWLFIAANLAALVNELDLRDDTITVRIAILVGAGMLMLVTSILVSFGWSAATSLSGLVKGSLAALVLYTIAVSTGGAGLRIRQTPELWAENTTSRQMDLLVSTADDLSEWNMGRAGKLALVVVNQDTAAVRWAFRDYPRASFVNALNPGVSPELVITPAGQEPGSASAYRGQDFTIHMDPQWQNLHVRDWLTWLMFRRMPEAPVSILLWARNDLFPVGSVSTETTLLPE